MRRPIKDALRVMTLLCAVVVSGCDDPDVLIDVTDARVYRQADKTVAVEVDLEGHERLGKNLGTYCVRVTFVPEDPAYHEDCKADLEDGDTKTVRLVSTKTDLLPGSAIRVRVRLAAVDVGRDLAAPP